MKQSYSGGCQCGKVRYEVAADIGEVISCNCSRCGRLGTLLTFVPTQDFKLLSGDDALTDYLFNKHVIPIASARHAAWNPLRPEGRLTARK